MSLKLIRTPLSLVLAGCLVTAFSARADIVIGVAGPFTGPNATYGDQYWHGATQAAEDINAAGGINGEKIKLVQGDDACEPKQAVAVANRLVDQDKVNAVVGHFCSSSTMPASEVYSDAGIIAITPGSTNPLITERGMSDMFRMCGRDDQQGQVASDFIIDKLKAKRVVIIHDKDTYGQGLADATKAALAKRGVQDVMFFSGDCIVNEEMVTAAGGPQYTNGIYMTFGKDPRLIPDGKAVIEKFRAGKFEPEGYTLYSYASVQAIAAAFKATGGKDSAKASEWLKANSVDTVMGKKAWDSKGDLKVSDYVVYQWDDKGKYKEVQ